MLRGHTSHFNSLMRARARLHCQRHSTQFATLSVGTQARSLGIIEVSGPPLQKGGSARLSAVVLQVAEAVAALMVTVMLMLLQVGSCEELHDVLAAKGFEVFEVEAPMATPEGAM
jgi:hypothetical protein